MKMNSERIDISNLSVKIANIDDMTEAVNYIAENEGMVIKNVMFPIYDCIHFNLSDTGYTNIECGKLIDNLYLIIKQNNDNSIIICDFEGIETVSTEFCKSFAKLLLQSKSKIIPTNMNASVSATFANFIEYNLKEETE